MKDSKQGELIEEESRRVESQILTPDAPLFIPKDEALRIRAPWCEKRQHRTSQFPAVEVAPLTDWSRIRRHFLKP
jgi:hypothetical protein